MENIILRILDDERNKIDSIRFLSNKDISFLKGYNNSAYNVDFYNGYKKVKTQNIDVLVSLISNNEILIVFNGFAEQIYSKAVITSLSAYKNSNELHIQLEHEITYTFSC